MHRPIRGNVYSLDDIRRQKDREVLSDVSREIDQASEDLLALLQAWFGEDPNEFVVACALGKVLQAIGDPEFPGSSTAHLVLEAVMADQLYRDIPRLQDIHRFLRRRRASGRLPFAVPLPESLRHYGPGIEAACYADAPGFRTLAFRSRFSTVAVVLDERDGEILLHCRECLGGNGRHLGLGELGFLGSRDATAASPWFAYCEDDVAALGDEGYVCTVRESCIPGQRTARLVVFNLAQICFLRDATAFLAILADMGNREH